MSKYIPAYTIFIFWILLPLPFMIMGYTSFMRLDFINVINNFEIGGINTLLGFVQLFGVYLKTFIMTIPNSPIWINMILLAVKGISLLTALFMLKE